jgi:hypothetical protein
VSGDGGDKGKCTIEVDVDGTAEVEIRGDLGVLRTISGSLAHWKRFVCNSVLPTNPNDFRFRGIDGRGRQELSREPRHNRGAALVRIDDPKGGVEGYTFDLEWRGGTNDLSSYDPYRPRDPFGTTWGREIRFSGLGDGYYRTDRGVNERLDDLSLDISRNGDVRLTFDTDRSGQIALTGRVEQTQGNRVIARVSGNNLAGDLTIRLDNRDRVRQVSLFSTGLDRAELRWQSDRRNQSPL